MGIGKYPEPATLFDDYSNRGVAVSDQDMSIEKTMTARDSKLAPPPRLTPEERKAWDSYYGPRNEAFVKAGLAGRDLVRWKFNRYMHDYLACVKAVDEGVGKVLDYLDSENLASNTIVLYASDQGFYLGEHGWFDKRWIFEESLSTPMLVRWPGHTRPGSSTQALVSIVDVAQTLLEAAGVPAHDRMQGRSFVPILVGNMPADWRRYHYYQYYEYPQPHRVRPHYGIVSATHKLVHFYGPDVDYWELYDRSSDPLELRNVIADSSQAAVLEVLRRELTRLRSDLKVPDEKVWPPAQEPRKGKKKAQKQVPPAE